jgi:hypothetical protein
MPRLILFLMLFTGCGVFETHSEKTNETTREEALLSLQASTLKAVEEGSIESAIDCDLALWLGLAKASGVDSIDLSSLEYAPGEIHRRPIATGPCWKDGKDLGSRSTVSRDMLTGYLWGRWVEGDLDAIQRLYDYGKARVWQMGEPKTQPEVFLMQVKVPGGGNLLGIICQVLGCEAPAVVYAPVSEDYAQHLQALGILLFGEVSGSGFTLDIDGLMRKRLEALVEGSPKDALFQAVLAVYSGDFTAAEDLILDPGYQCPSYVRPLQIYCQTHKAFVLRTILKRRPAA